MNDGMGREANRPNGAGRARSAWLTCLGVCAFGAAAAGAAGIKEKRPTYTFKVRLTLERKAPLTRSQVTHALLPGGKHVGLTYTGVEDPETIAHYTKLGFRTSIGVTPQTSVERIKALEAAGADLVVSGGIGPEMGLTPQEAFDGSAMRRWNLLKTCRSRVAVGPYNNMRNNFYLPVNRDMGRYLYAIHDSNFLACNTWAAGYKVIVGRNRTPEQIVRPHNKNRARGAPNTLVYYQTVANILQGIVEMMSAGEVTTIGLRDFKKADQAKVDRFIGRFGRDERIWHTTQHAICGYAYAKEKSRIVDVASVSDTEVDVTLALEADTFIPFCTAPMCLKLPADLPVKSARLGSTDCPVAAKDKGVYVDIPLQKAFAADCRMTLAKPESMTIPEEMPVTLTLRNTSGKPMSDVRLRWAGTVGTEVRGGDEKPFALAPDAERKVQAVVRTIRGPRRGVRPKGARFGLAPVTAIVTATVDGEQRVSAASWEVLVAPRLRVEMDPRGVPIGKGREFVFFVHLANGRVDTDRAWGDFHDEKLIDHRTGPCKGTVGFDLPDGMEAVPPTQPFDLPADGHATLRFVVRNRKWGDAQPVYVRPAIRFAGETDPIEVPWFGTRVMRDVESEGKPLDEKGLLAQASWDDRKNTRGNLDRAAGSTAQSCPGASGGGQTPCHEGVKKWCLGWNSNIAFDAWRNIDHRRGTVMFWWRRDSRVRNDIRTRPDRAESWKVPGRSKNHGEKLFCAGIHRDLILRRYPKHRQREGYLELVLREMPVRGRPTKVHYVQADFETARLYDWRHVAIVWDLKARRLELYLDGELAGRAEKGEEEWLVMPFDRGRKTHGVVLVETHHGHWSGSNRDEFYIYNRPLTPEEIRANMALAKR